MIILLDLDGVVVDIDKQFGTFWKKLHPDKPLPDVSTRKQFHIGSDLFPKEHSKHAFDVFKQPGYYRHAPFMPGAKEAVLELWNSDDHEVYFVTSASNSMPLAPSEKYQWVSEYLGVEFVNNLIICQDKSMIRGDILVDDKPEVRGESNATWEHVLYDASYNREVPYLRRMTWKSWREVLLKK